MNKSTDKYKNGFYQSLFIGLLLMFALEIIPFENQDLKTIVELLFSLSHCSVFLFLYLILKFRILLVNFYCLILYLNLKLLTIDSFGMKLFSFETTFKISQYYTAMNGILLLFVILGAISIKIKFKWISDTVDYAAKRILIETISFTVLFQTAIRYVVNNHV